MKSRIALSAYEIDLLILGLRALTTFEVSLDEQEAEAANELAEYLDEVLSDLEDPTGAGVSKFEVDFEADFVDQEDEAGEKTKH